MAEARPFQRRGMTPGQQVEAQIFAELRTVHGEALTLVTRGSSSVDGLVRRPEVFTDDEKRNVDFTLRESSIIQFPIAAVNPVVKVGEAIQDSAGKTHRVQKILPAPGFVKLICRVSS